MTPVSRSASAHYVDMETHKCAQPLHDTPPMTLEWRDLTLQVSTKNPQTKQSEAKTILSQASGVAKPGEVLVIMGPSGAGKSTLLDCISGRNREVEGSITVNGQPWSKKMKRLASYIQQDDLFYETITVFEHLVFQAQLRMGRAFTADQYLKRVATVMEELGLNKSRDTLIGGARVRGISGGERKRLSFATEILTNPSILFVDEPTSGLDSFMAETIVSQMRKLARDGRTVIATIHQPSSELFALFDKLYLLSDGSPVYHGAASEAVPYFASLGYQCPPFVNPSEYFMRQLVVMDKTTDQPGVARLEQLKQEWCNRPRAIQSTEAAGTDVVTPSDNDVRFQDSQLNLWRQMGVLARRNATRIIRDTFALRAGAFQALFIAVIAGLVFLQLDITQSGIQNFAGCFFFVAVNITFINANPTFVAVPLELPIVIREYKGGLYHLLSWYLAKNLSELVTQIILPIVYFAPIYLLVGVGHGFKTYFYMQIIAILVASTSIGLGYMVSCLTRRVEIAPIVGLVLILPFVLLGGLLINSDDCPDYLVWILYVSPIKYGFEALMKLFWNKISAIPCGAAIETCVATTGAQVLQNYGMNSRSPMGDALLLLAINLSFRVIGFLALWLNLRKTK